MAYHSVTSTVVNQDGQPLIEGKLKEKQVRWKFIKRWKTRYFTLAGNQLLFQKGKCVSSFLVLYTCIFKVFISASQPGISLHQQFLLGSTILHCHSITHVPLALYSVNLVSLFSLLWEFFSLLTQVSEDELLKEYPVILT